MLESFSGIRLIIFDDQQKFSTSWRNPTIETSGIFSDLPSCLTFFESDHGKKEVFIVLTTSIDDRVLESFQKVRSVQFIFVISPNEKNIENCPSKVVGSFTSFDLMQRLLQETIEKVDLNLSLNSFLWSCRDDGDDNLSFYFFYLWKIVSKDLKKSEEKNFVERAREMFQNNPNIRSHIDVFEKNYKSSNSISWLDRTRHPFPFSVPICHALRTHNNSLMNASRTLISDVQKQMKSVSSISQNRFYLGVQAPIGLVERLEQHDSSKPIAFQCFLPLTKSRSVAFAEAIKPNRHTERMNILFKIDLNGAPFAPINDDNVFIDLATPFHVSCVTRSSASASSTQLLTTVKLRALDVNEQKRFYDDFLARQESLNRTARDLYERLCSGISDEEDEADECVARNEYAKAIEVLRRIKSPPTRVLNRIGSLYRDRLHDSNNALIFYDSALNKAEKSEKAECLVYRGLALNDLKNHEESFRSLSEALAFIENEKVKNLQLLARCLTGMSNAKTAMKQLDDALDFAKRALAIRENQINPVNNVDVAMCQGNLANIICKKGDLTEAISLATKSIELYRSCGLKGSLRLGGALNNVGAMYQALGDYEKAEQYFNEAIECIPDESHPYRRSTMVNVAENQRRKSSLK